MQYFSSIWLIFFCFFSAGHSEQRPTCTIRGTISNDQVKKITIGEAQVGIDPVGRFAHTLEIREPKRLAIRYADTQFELYLQPHSTVDLSFNAEEIFESLDFCGPNGGVNRYLLEIGAVYHDLKGHFRTDSPEWKTMFSRDERSFLLELERLKSSVLKVTPDRKTEQECTQREVCFAVEKSIEFSVAWMMTQYPYFHERYTGKAINLSERTKAYLDSLQLDAPGLIEVDGYYELGQALLHPRIRHEFRNNAELKPSDNRWLSAAMNVVDRVFKTQAVHDFWAYHHLKTHIENNGIKHIEPFLARFNHSCLSEELKATLHSLYDTELKKRQDHPVVTYKTVDGFNLDAHVFVPADLKDGEKRPAIVYFHGGSWSEGKPDWQFGYSKTGLVSVCIEYRTYDRYGCLPFEQIADAKSAIRWLREHADLYHIDPEKIVASGNSAGGHLALCTALLDTLDERDEDSAISSKPNALILTSAVFRIAPGIWFDELVEDPQRLQGISPLGQVKPGLPPMLIFHGTDDRYSADFNEARTFVKMMKESGNNVYFYPIQGKGHFLWLHGEYWQISAEAIKEFYKILGYLPKA